MYADCRVRGFKVRIPFVCRMCGECCRKLSKVVYDPRTDRLYMEGVELEGFEVPKEYKGFAHPVKIPCPFLKGNVCEIHDIRPRSCREYPLLTGDLGVDCPALKSFKKFLKAFNPERIEYVVDDVSVEPVEIPAELFEVFMSLNPSDEEVEAFLRLNRIREKFKS